MHLENFQKKNYKLFFFNRKKYMLKNNYYLEGFFKTKLTKFSFKKAYILGGKIYFFDVKGYINKSKIKAKEVVYSNNRTYELKKCEVKNSSHIIRRKKYILQER